MIDIVTRGGGVGAFPGAMVRPHLESGQLVRLPDMPPLPKIAFHVAVRAAESDPLVLAIFGRARPASGLDGSAYRRLPMRPAR